MILATREIFCLYGLYAYVYRILDSLEVLHGLDMLAIFYKEEVI